MPLEIVHDAFTINLSAEALEEIINRLILAPSNLSHVPYPPFPAKFVVSIRSTRWPLHLAAPDDMNMNVMNSLTGIWTSINDDSVTRLRDTK